MGRHTCKDRRIAPSSASGHATHHSHYQVWVERGEQLLFIEPTQLLIGKVSTAYALKSHQYIRLQVGWGGGMMM